MRTRKAAFERMQRVSAILAKRYSGMALADIGAEENPPCSAQNIHQLIERALAQAPQQSVAEIRLLEVHRLDQLLAAVWSNAMAGDLPAVDRCLAIMYRRARLLGLDLQTGVLRFRDYEMGEGDDQPGIKVEIVNNPEAERMRWLERERERLLEAASPVSDPPKRVN